METAEKKENPTGIGFVRENPVTAIIMANFIGFVVMAMAYALPMSFMQTIFSKISYILELPGMVIANALFNGVIEITFLKYVSVAVVNTVFYILVYYVVTFFSPKK